MRVRLLKASRPATATAATAASSSATAATNFFAAGAATALTRLALHPLDTLRTRVQASTPRAQLTLRTLPSLYAGFLPSVLGSVPAQSVYFSAYSLFRALPLPVAPAAALANTIAALVRVPPEVLKQRAQAGLTSDSALVAVCKIIQAEGPQGLWRGLPSQVRRDVPFAVLLYIVYEACAPFRDGGSYKSSDVTSLRLSHRARFLTPRVRGLLTGALAGAVASAATAPLDLLKTRAMTARAGPTIGFLRSVTDILKQEGPAALWKGTSYRIAYKCCSSALFFVLLESFRPRPRKQG
jgi:solute carrier family 25 (mitochondrial S-adenosylmethionine transporter), member 26